MSRVQLRAIAPCLLTLPYVGRSPATPQLFAGLSIEPHVSEPMAKGTRPALTAAPEPLEEPPVQVSVFHGFLGGPVKEAWGCL